MLIEYNNIIRSIAAKENLTIYDFDRDIWSTVDHNTSFEHSLYRDWVHPRSFYVSLVPEKLLGYRYSASMIFQDSIKKYYNNRFNSFEGLPGIVVHFIRVEGQSEVYYHHKENGSYHAHPMQSFFQMLKLSMMDVRVVSESYFSSQSRGQDIPDVFHDDRVLNASNRLYFIQNLHARYIPNMKVFHSLKFHERFVIVSVRDLWLSVIPHG